jgi:hypothetical protein
LSAISKSALRTVGYLYLVIIIAFIAVNWALVVVYEGKWQLLDILSPRDVGNIAVTLALLLPGVVLIYLGRRMA